MQLAEVCRRAFDERYRHSPRPLREKADQRLREELALIAELGLSGFFLLHWEVLELARDVAAQVRGPGSPRHLLPPGRGRGSSVGSIVCYLTGLSHVDPVDAGLAIGRFLNRELSSVPDIDLDFPGTSARSSSSPSPSATGAGTRRSSRALPRTAPAAPSATWARRSGSRRPSSSGSRA